MPTRNTPPRPPIEQWATEDLLEEFGLALRDVAVWEGSLPDDPKARSHVERVQRTHAELARRGVELGSRLAELSGQTDWLMAPLLEETLRFPAVVPAVREADGVRRQYRCPRCRSAEVPDREGIWLCDACLAAAVAAVRAPGPLEGLVVLRTYTPEKWCPHADAETVMVAAEEYDDGLGPCYCAECLAAEQRRRAGRRATAAASAT